MNSLFSQKGVPGTKCNTKKPNPAAKTIETAIISRPEAIPPCSNAIKLVIFINIIHRQHKSNCVNYSNHPNLLFIVQRRKNIEDSETIVPNIINGFDFSLSFFLDKDLFLSLLTIFEKGFFTFNSKFNGFLVH